MDAVVVSHRNILNNEYEIKLSAPPIANNAQPGQFVHLLVGDGYSPFIRRPFSIYKASADEGTFSIVYLARGSFTSGLARYSPGGKVSVLGPLGNGFNWHSNPHHRSVLVAGGIGAPPIHFLAERVHSIASEPKAVVINGARTRDLLVGVDDFARLPVMLHVLTEDGTHGMQGRVTDALDKLLEESLHIPSTIYACGPMGMLHAIGDIAQSYGVECQVSIETSMACGTGACYGCAVRVKDETGSRVSLACCEGPVFRSDEYLWDEAV